MSLPTIITITNTSVNTGDSINTNATSINTAWESFSSVKEQPRTSITIDYTDSLPTSRNTGVGSPTHTIQGVIDLNDSVNNTGVDTPMTRTHYTGLINYSNLTMTLKSNKFVSNTNNTGEVLVRLMNYSDTLTNENLVNYTMIFREVSS